MTKRNVKSESGFTLIELLIVVAILGILAAVAIPQFRGYQAQAKINAVKANHKAVATLLGGEFAKCSAGATNFQMGNAAAVACNGATAATMTTALVTYMAAEAVMNPYTPTAAAITNPAAAGTAEGNTYLTVAGNVVTVTSIPFTGATALVNTIVKE